MRFSTRTRYGLRFLIRLASTQDLRLQLGVVAKEEKISSGYLEQIVRALRPLKILKAVRGVGGGYQLCKSPADIRLDDVIQALEGGISPVSCLTSYCPRQDICTTREFWEDMDRHLRGYLHSKTLQDLVKKPRTLLTEYSEGKEI
ncbi:MAG: Rrf2 family transcriptional regulator [Desulfovibrio sp.]|nr:Rrf2 family transcriptional regulator [Desulfovibrio sp.]MDD7477768.1 Rrf2 family transcriptional regulator [Desulfovibrio sp.]MDY5486761.1 Rrf2 family transcriptional regulator [Desulfovibrio sp.]MEE0406199.1 Rrf2 family transcriptional regulator [Desulfovibrio sp.]HAK22150.1 transcriptional regulator [Desulfovibrio sp.]